MPILCENQKESVLCQLDKSYHLVTLLPRVNLKHTSTRDVWHTGCPWPFLPCPPSLRWSAPVPLPLLTRPFHNLLSSLTPTNAHILHLHRLTKYPTLFLCHLPPSLRAWLRAQVPIPRHLPLRPPALLHVWGFPHRTHSTRTVSRGWRIIQEAYNGQQLART